MAIKWLFTRVNIFQQVRMTLLNIAHRYHYQADSIRLEDHIYYNSLLSFEANKGDFKNIEIKILPDESERQPFFQINSYNSGLIGALGALPSAYTEWLIQRYYRHGDSSAHAFLNIFSNRFCALEHSAWVKCHYYAQAEFSRYLPLSRPLLALNGQLTQSGRTSNSKQLSDIPLVTATHSLANLTTILRKRFQVEVEIVPFIGRWLETPADWQIQLGQSSLSMGNNPMLGHTLWEHQTTFLVRLNKVKATQLENLLLKGHFYRNIVEQVKEFVNIGLRFYLEVFFDGQKREKRPLEKQRLGVDCYLGEVTHCSSVNHIQFPLIENE